MVCVLRTAVKIVSKMNFKRPDDAAMFHNEMAILRELDHPNIVKAYDFFETESHLYVPLFFLLCTILSFFTHHYMYLIV